MKLATSLALALILACSAAVLALEPTTSNTADMSDMILQKDAAVVGEPNPQSNVGGEDIGTAVPIPVLPYSDAGNTCAYIHDYDEACDYSGSLSPDVVYSLSPASDMAVDISLCNSLYDTKVYVYENVAGATVACNDDACGDDGFKSELSCVPMTAGNTYYVVVDGYGSGCGDYEMMVSASTGPCDVECPPGSHLEGEPDCYDGYDDQYNGGCNSDPPVFTSVPCSGDGSGVTVCGTYGGFVIALSNFRDTDWYVLDAASNTGTTVACVEGEYETIFGYITPDICDSISTFDEYVIVDPFTPGCLNIPAGEMWLFVSVPTFGPSAGACGGSYVLTVDGYNCPPVAVDEASWGEIKNQYR